MRVGIVGRRDREPARPSLQKHRLQHSCVHQRDAEKGRKFAAAHDAEFIRATKISAVILKLISSTSGTFPAFRLEVVRACAAQRKSVQVQKPIAVDVKTAREMIDVARTGRRRAGRREPTPVVTAPASSCRQRFGRIGSEGCCSATHM